MAKQQPAKTDSDKTRPVALRRIHWPYMSFSAALVVLLALALGALPSISLGVGALIAFVLVVVYSIVARTLVLGPYLRGMRHFKKKEYREALACFRQTETLLARQPWIDRLRWMVLLSASAVGYREMARYNTAACQVQLGQVALARKTLKQLLAEAPASPLAPLARRSLGSLRQGA